MKYFDYLIKLTEHFKPGVGNETTIFDISKLLTCSERHVKTIVQYLNEEGYINWKVQRGRGKKPTITIIYSNEQLCLNYAKQKIQQGQYQQAFRIVENLGDSSRIDIQEWFIKHVGFSRLQQRNKAGENLDILTYPFYETDLSMDPLHIQSRHDSHMVQQIFDRLVEYDPNTSQLKPSIAHSWESVDGKLWTFYLHKGIKFHHGRALTSEDVKLTFSRYPKKDILMTNIEYIEIIDKDVIQFQLKNVDYLFPRHLSGMKFSIVPLEVVKNDYENFRRFPVGSGPYKITQHNENKIRLEVFAKYFGVRPWLDRIEIIKTPTPFKGDEGLPLLLHSLDESWEQVRMLEKGAAFIAFNCKENGPLRDQDFREVISSSLNQQDYLAEKESRRAACSFVTDRSIENSVINVKNCSMVSDTEIILKIGVQQIRDGVNFEEEAKILQKQLLKVNITSHIELVDFHRFSGYEEFQDFDLFVGGIALADDQLLSVITALQSQVINIYHFLNEPMRQYVDRQVSYIQQLTDESDRWKTYFQTEEYLKGNYAICFLYHRYHTVYKSKNSRYVNLELDSNGRVDYRKVWKRAGQLENPT
ncbi:ABC transporter substrate-binding protein [Cytobacillus sp. Hm23]